MVLDVCSNVDFNSIIKDRDLVLVLVYERNGYNGYYLARLVEDVAWRLEPVFSVLRVDKGCAEDWVEKVVGSSPRIVLFYRGKKVREQIGFFHRSSVDKRSIGRGLLHALRRLSLHPSRLGVRLNF